MFKKRSKKLQQLSDLELVANYQLSEDNACLEILYERFSHLVYGVCLKYLKNVADSQDMVITVFQKLMNDLKTTEVNNFQSWLYVVTKNQCLMLLRKQSRERDRKKYIEEVGLNEKYADTVEEQFEVKEAKLTALEKAMKQLKPEQKLCVDLFYLKEKSYNEVADETGFTLKQVKSYIQNGKRNLGLLMARENENS